MRISIFLFVCGQPSDVYISIGPLRRLIYYLFMDYPPMYIYIYINWAAPTIDILFVCGLPSDEYQLGRSDD